MQVMQAVAEGKLGRAPTVLPLGRVTAIGPDSQVYGRPGGAMRAQLEIAPGPAPGRVLPGFPVTIGALPSPSRGKALAVPIPRGGVNALARWEGAVEQAVREDLRARVRSASPVRAHTQRDGIAYYKTWNYGRVAPQGTFRGRP